MREPRGSGHTAGGLQRAQATFSFGEPDTDGNFAERHDGQNGSLTPKT